MRRLTTRGPLEPTHEELLGAVDVVEDLHAGPAAVSGGREERGSAPAAGMGDDAVTDGVHPCAGIAQGEDTGARGSRHRIDSTGRGSGADQPA